MRLGEGQCRNVFRLDKKACQACAGYNKTCPAYSPAGPGKKTEKLNGSEKRTVERGGVDPAHHGAQRFEAAGRFEPGAPLREVCVHTKKQLCGGCETGESKDKSINADSGVGNKGVKADPRRTAKAAGFTILHLPPPGGIRAGRPQPQAAGAARCEYCAPSGSP